MLGDEERKAIETLTNKRPSEQILISGKMCVNVLINLINKQSKEIEELKDENRTQRKQLNDAFDRGWVHEDKIKAKIEELDKMKSNGKYTILFNSDNVMEVVKAVLQSLLEKE